MQQWCRDQAERCRQEKIEIAEKMKVFSQPVGENLQLNV
jgi:hypothetical protein